jgi:hypothetical protein
MRFLAIPAVTCAILAALPLAGCATIQGSQRPIIGVAQTSKLVQEKYDLKTVLYGFGHPNDAMREGLSKREYRDMVIGIYMSAIDARYHEFRTNLSSESKRAALGLDVAVIGLAGWASVAKQSIVNEVSAVAGGVAGTRAAVDKNLYFDKALPALIAAMETERLKIGAQILRNLERNTSEYPLALAIGDLNRYEMAGSLDLAIQMVTSQAADERKKAESEYENAIRACDTSEDEAEDVIAKTREVSKIVDKLDGNPPATPPDTENLKEVVRTMGLQFPEAADADALVAIISNDLIANYCSGEKLDGLLAQLNAKGLTP